jgi:hypothetical protein
MFCIWRVSGIFILEFSYYTYDVSVILTVLYLEKSTGAVLLVARLVSVGCKYFYVNRGPLEGINVEFTLLGTSS